MKAITDKHDTYLTILNKLRDDMKAFKGNDDSTLATALDAASWAVSHIGESGFATERADKAFDHLISSGETCGVTYLDKITRKVNGSAKRATEFATVAVKAMAACDEAYDDYLKSEAAEKFLGDSTLATATCDEVYDSYLAYLKSTTVGFK